MSIAHRNSEVPEVVNAVVENAARSFDFAVKCQQELVRFSGFRLSRYLDLQTQLRECANPLDAMKAHMDFMVKMQADYLKQSALMTEGLLNTGKVMAEAVEEAMPAKVAVTIAEGALQAEPTAASDSEVTEMARTARKPKHAA